MRFQKTQSSTFLFLLKVSCFSFLFFSRLNAAAVAGSLNPQSSAAPLKTFTLRLPGEPETLDWNIAHTMVETYVLMNLMEGLVSFEQGLKISPALASSWTVSPDGKIYTFKIRPNVKWSDGVPLRAQDFVYSWKRLLSPLTAASYAYFLFDIAGAEEFNRGTNKDFEKVGIKALDELTLQVTLARPVAYWIYIPGFWVTFPLRQDVVEKHGNAWAKPGRMITLGPYNLESYEPDAKVVLRANPNYFGKKGNVEKVVALVVKDSSTAMNLYEAGKLDLLTDLATLDMKRSLGRHDLKTFPYLKAVYLGINVSKFPVNQLKVRRAIAMAIDKSKIGEILWGGQQKASTFVPPGLLGHSSNVGLSYDPKKAREELASAGIPVGQPLSLEIIVPNWDKTITLCQYVQAELKKNLGIDVIVQPFDHKTFRAQLDLKIYHAFIISWGADYPDPDNFVSVFLTNSGNNRTSWGNPEYDQLVFQARTLLDEKKRTANYLKAQKILEEDGAAVIPLFYEPNRALVKPRVQGLEINPLNMLLIKKINVLQ